MQEQRQRRSSTHLHVDIPGSFEEMMMKNFLKEEAHCMRRHRRTFVCQYWMQPMTDLTTEKKSSRKLLRKKTIEAVVVVDHYYDGVVFEKKTENRLPHVLLSRLHLPSESVERQSVHRP